MLTIDASVHMNALDPGEEGSAESQAFLDQVFGRPWPVFSPTLLLVELAGTAARALDDDARGLAVAQAVHGLPGQVWVPLDEPLAEEAGQVAARFRLRDSDAVYAAVARRNGAILVTRDRQQLERLQGTQPVLSPAEARDWLLARGRARAAE
jgi:predicted nucleic acid-binding protein